MVSSKAKVPSGHVHAVRFYDNAEELCRIVADFLAEGIARAESAVVFGTSEHREAIAQGLTARSLDVDQLEQRGDLFLLDAETTLAGFMVDGMPDPVRFRNVLVPVLEKACRGRTGRSVRVYGEIVDVLWKAGQTMAATRLETHWNVLANTHDFSLLCGYSMGHFYKNAAVDDICSHHSHTVSATGEMSALI